MQNEPYVIEYNVRLGDPETQTIMPRIESDFLELLTTLKTQEKFKKKELNINQNHATTVILTSKGYPEKYTTGHILTGLNNLNKSTAFHAGLKQNNTEHITSGGRVLAITALGDTIENSINNAYSNVKKIKFNNIYFRKDIGADIK